MWLLVRNKDKTQDRLGTAMPGLLPYYSTLPLGLLMELCAWAIKKPRWLQTQQSTYGSPTMSDQICGNLGARRSQPGRPRVLITVVLLPLLYLSTIEHFLVICKAKRNQTSSSSVEAEATKVSRNLSFWKTLWDSQHPGAQSRVRQKSLQIGQYGENAFSTKPRCWF